MIRLIEALNFRCLRYVFRPLSDFEILIGPNASGKTTFLDTASFLGDLLSRGLDEAITERSTDIHDLFFLRQGDRFEIAVELEAPEEQVKELGSSQCFPYVRYEISVGLDQVSGEHHIFDEQVILLRELSQPRNELQQRTLFPMPAVPPETIMHGKYVGKGKKRSVRKSYHRNDNFYSEIEAKKSKGGWAPSFKLGPRKSALANMPEDQRTFPISTWLRETLIEGTQKLMLNSMALRQSSRPGQGRWFRPDGSNLPWVIEGLRKEAPERYRQWIDQLGTALPDIRDVLTVEIPDTKHRFLQVVYEGGLKAPSWVVSDGTLRMLALTLPAYLPDFEGIYLIEEPENGIHPMAIETVYQSFKSVYNAQMLLATHSPVILSCADPSEILCFKKDDSGAVDIVSGPEHPALAQWKESLNLADLYASGVLG